MTCHPAWHSATAQQHLFTDFRRWAPSHDPKPCKASWNRVIGHEFRVRNPDLSPKSVPKQENPQEKAGLNIKVETGFLIYRN
jgi:hypothetical protein